MPALTTVPDAQRPIGRFITERVLPQWDSMNTHKAMYSHLRALTITLRRRDVQVRSTGGPSAAFLFNGRVIGGRHGRETTLVSAQAADACGSKTLTRQYWAAAGVPTAQASLFSPDQLEQARGSIQDSESTPLVMKPNSGRHGAGVSFGVTADGFDAAWQKALTADQSAEGVDEGNEGVLLEEFTDALNLRFFIVAGDVRSVTLRVPLFVVGDGASTVQQLVKEAFKHQQSHILLRRTRPKITAELVASTGRELSDVPEAGTLTILSEDPGLLFGGLPHNVLSLVSPDLIRLATDAALAIPGLGAAGIDVLAPALDSAEGAVALDAHPNASLAMHSYPAFGPRRLVAKSLANQLRARADQWNRPAYSGGPGTSATADDDDDD